MQIEDTEIIEIRDDAVIDKETYEKYVRNIKDHYKASKESFDTIYGSVQLVCNELEAQKLFNKAKDAYIRCLERKNYFLNNQLDFISGSNNKSTFWHDPKVEVPPTTQKFNLMIKRKGDTLPFVKCSYLYFEGAGYHFAGPAGVARNKYVNDDEVEYWAYLPDYPKSFEERLADKIARNDCLTSEETEFLVKKLKG